MVSRGVRVIALSFVIMLGFCTVVGGQEATPSATPESNQEDRAIVFYPEATGQGTFISFEINPGESQTATVILGNAGNIDQSIRTYVIPAQTVTNGGLAIPERGTENDFITEWLTYPETVLELAPGEGKQIEVVVTVPEDATPGEFVTVLAAEQADAFAVEGTDLFTQKVRWSVPILITVPGERHQAFELGGGVLEWDKSSLYATVQIANTGNVIVRPEGEVRLLNADGEVIGVASVDMDSVYTGTATTFVVGWSNVPESESYGVEISLATEDGTVTAEDSAIGLIPVNSTDSAAQQPLTFESAELVPLTRDNPPSTLQLSASINNNGEPIESARVSIVTYQDGVEVDRYPIMQAVTINQGTTPVEARYSLPGGFTKGTYTFEVTIELGDAGTQTVLVTQSLDYEITVP